MLPYYHSIHTLHWLPQTAPSHFIVYCNPPALPIKNWSSYLSYIHPILFIIKFIAPTLSSLSINMVTSSVCFSSSKMTQSLPVKAKDPPGQQLRKWLIRKLTILLEHHSPTNNGYWWWGGFPQASPCISGSDCTYQRPTLTTSNQPPSSSPSFSRQDSTLPLAVESNSQSAPSTPKCSTQSNQWWNPNPPWHNTTSLLFLSLFNFTLTCWSLQRVHWPTTHLPSNMWMSTEITWWISWRPSIKSMTALPFGPTPNHWPESQIFLPTPLA